MKSLAESFTPRLDALAARARAMQALTESVRKALPADLRTHVVSATYRDDTLVVLVDSSAWCAQIRYAEEELKARLASQCERSFAKLRVRVSPPAQAAASGGLKDAARD